METHQFKMIMIILNPMVNIYYEIISPNYEPTEAMWSLAVIIRCIWFENLNNHKINLIVSTVYLIIMIHRGNIVYIKLSFQPVFVVAEMGPHLQQLQETMWKRGWDQADFTLPDLLSNLLRSEKYCTFNNPSNERDPPVRTCRNSQQNMTTHPLAAPRMRVNRYLCCVSPPVHSQQSQWSHSNKDSINMSAT